MALKLDSDRTLGTITGDNETAPGEAYYALAGNDTVTGSGGYYVLGSGNDLFQGAGSSAFGGEGADTLVGGADFSFLTGGSGADSLVGGTESDRLYGDCMDMFLAFCNYVPAQFEGGADTLSGGAGLDLLIGGEGADRLSGGADADLFVWERSSEFGDTITDFTAGADGDLLFFPNLIIPSGTTPSASGFVTFTQSGADTLVHLDRDGGAETYSSQLVATLLNVTASEIDTGSQLIGFTVAPVFLEQDYKVVGSEWADTVTRTLADMSDPSSVFPLYTLGGDDTVTAELAGAGYFLGDGNDRFIYQTPAFDPFPNGLRVYGDRGADTISGGPRADNLYGGSGADSLVGDNGDDQLFGDCGDMALLYCGMEDYPVLAPGADTLQGGEGIDLLHGGGGADRLDGGAGSDLFVWENTDEFGDTITGFVAGAEGDRLFFNDLIVPQPGVTAAASYLKFQQSGGNTLVYLDRDASGSAYSDQLVVTLQGVSLTLASFAAGQIPGLLGSGVQQLGPLSTAVASYWADAVDLTDEPGQSRASIYLFDGNDTVTSSLGGDYALGKGDDRFLAKAGTTEDLDLYGDQGNDTLVGGDGDDDLTGGSGVDSLIGGAGDDEFAGDCYDRELSICGDTDDTMESAMVVVGGADTIDGGAGNDIIVGGFGADDLTGGSGDDLFVYENVDEFGDTIRDFAPGASGDRIVLTALITLTAGAPASAYTELRQAGSDTELWIDRDATGPVGKELVATLKNVTAAAILPAQVLLGEEARVQMPANAAPTAANASFTVIEDSSAAGQLPAATDADGDPVTYWKSSEAAHGTATVSASGAYTYAPAGNYSGPDSFGFTVGDGKGGTTAYTVTVTVSDVNDAPVANNASANGNEDVAITGNLQAADVDSVTLTFSAVDQPAHGTISVNANGSYTYTPASNYRGADAFTFKANDGALDSNVATVSITVNAVNDAPVAGNPSAMVDEDGTLVGNAPASDVDSATLTFSVVTPPVHGTLLLNPDGFYTYRPAANYNGPDAFSFKANDGALDSAPGTVSISVVPVNDAPVVANVDAGADEDTTINGTLAATDADNAAFTFSADTQPVHGTLVLSPTGSYQYVPDANFAGVDSFSYKANDGSVDSNVATVSITVDPINDAPRVANAIPDQGAPIDRAFSYTVSADAFNDVDNATLTYSATLAGGAPLPAWLTFAPGTRTFSGTPSGSDVGNLSVVVTASDGSLSTSDTFLLSVTLLVNQPPTAGNATFMVNEDSSASGQLPAATDTDGDPVTYAKSSEAAHGTATVSAGGAYTYAPAGNYSGPDSFGFTVSDGRGGSNQYTVNVTVNPVNDAPVATNSSASGNEDTEVVGNVVVSDIDSAGLNYSVVTQPAHGTVSFIGGAGYRYVPAANWNGADSFTFRANDGALNSNTATVSLTVAAVNDAPVIAVGIADQAASAGSAFNFTFAANNFSDVDDGTLIYTSTLSNGNALPAWLSFNPATRTFSGTPQVADAGTLTVKVTASDGRLSVADVFSLSVTTVAGIQVTGTAGRDTLTGGAGSDTINGLAGSDLITGLAGNDTIDGGEGIDTAVYAATRAQATIALGSTTTPNSATVSVPGLGTDSLTRVERLHFTDLDVAFDITPTGNVLDPITKGEGGNAGKAYRLYQAALARTPDLAGLGYWIVQVDNGETLFNIASGFLGSDEFKGKYGANPTNAEYTRALYLNVLHREPDADGYAYFNALLEGKPWNGTDYGSTTRQQMLVDFSESVENKANAIEIIGNGFDYTPWV